MKYVTTKGNKNSKSGQNQSLCQILTHIHICHCHIKCHNNDGIKNNTEMKEKELKQVYGLKMIYNSASPKICICIK